jgi:hypothetical protein
MADIKVAGFSAGFNFEYDPSLLSQKQLFSEDLSTLKNGEYDVFTSFDNAILDDLKSRVCLSTITEKDWTSENNVQLAKFSQDASQLMLIIYDDPQRGGLQLSCTFPTIAVKELTFFIRKSNLPITKDNFLDVVQFGTLLPDNSSSLLKIMQGMYSPIIFSNKSWPDSIFF